MRYFLSILFFLLNASLIAQSKKEQIIDLNYKIDSLTLITQSNKEKIISLNFKIDSLVFSFTDLKRNSDATISKQNVQISASVIAIKELNIEVDVLKINLNKKNIELDSIKKSLELAKIEEERLFFDTINAKVTYNCYYYESDFPYIISSTTNDSIRKNINLLIREASFKIPSIMDNQDYKSFRKCEEGDYNHITSLHLQHVTNDGCDWCQSEFYSSVTSIEQSNYISILFSVLYTAGGNWGNKGYNSLNLKNNKIITIPNNLNVKKKLIEEVKDYLIYNPFNDTDGKKYPILDEIQKWGIEDLTFYFKNNTLRLIFVNGAHGVWNQTFDIPLPKMQQYLNL